MLSLPNDEYIKVDVNHHIKERIIKYELNPL